MENLEGLRDEILAAVRQAPDLDALEGARISALGRKGRITTLMKGLAALAADERRGAGQALNALQGEVAAAIAERPRSMLAIASAPSLSITSSVKSARV